MSRVAFALAAVMSVAMAVPGAGQGRGAGPGYPKFFDANMLGAAPPPGAALRPQP